MEHKVELLAPAGSMEAFRGAVNAGADAVYLAGKQFGARAYADNFDEKQIEDVIRRAHLFGMRTYLTVNILTRQEELQTLGGFVLRMYEAGLDGVIVQDLGVAALLRRLCPSLELHASTQMSVTGPEAVQFLKKQGFTRVVPAREMSLEEIGLIKKEGIEVESFVHGAMCYSYSGKCLMSSFLGGRSGNRGRCAGTCRLPYEILDGKGKPLGRDGSCYPISMRDMCVLPILPELIDAGIDSFKIEGRMKKPEYVAGTVAVYRKYIDRFYRWDAEGRPGKWELEKKDVQKLQSLYIRSELCQGYYHIRNGRSLLTVREPGYKGTDPELLTEIRKRYLQKDKKAQIAGKAVLISGRRAVLQVWLTAEKRPHEVICGESEAVIQKARNQALTEETIRDKLIKTGDFPFQFCSLQVITDGNAFLSLAELGELRRSTLEKLLEACAAPSDAASGAASAETSDVVSDAVSDAASAAAPDAASGAASDAAKKALAKTRHTTSENAGLMVMVQSVEQASTVLDWKRLHPGRMELILDAEARDDCDAILNRIARDTAEASAAVSVSAALPYVLRASDRSWMSEFYDKYKNKFCGFVTRTLEELEILIKEEYNNKVIVDSVLYTWNRESEAVLRQSVPKSGQLQMVLPLELDRRELLRTFSEESGEGCGLEDKILTVYGRAPLMISANCVRKTCGRCLAAGADGDDRSGVYCALKDRTGAIFPVKTDCRHCQNTIYNSVPTSLHKFTEDPLFREAGAVLVSFTTEGRREVIEVLNIFGEPAGSRRHKALLQTQLCLGSSFTNGHYKKGAL